MNFSNFELRIDFAIDGNQIVFVTEKVEEGTKVSVHLRRTQSWVTGV